VTSSKATPRKKTKRYEYLLGDSRKESARLRRQAALWDPTTFALFDRLKLRRGMRVLEIGPGQGSPHAELRRRLRGPVDAVERSAAFASRLRAAWARDGLGDATLWQCDLLDADLPDRHYDVVFARWVFLFLPDAPRHLAKLSRALAPGGRLVIQDYLRDTFSLSPRPAEWDAFAAADRAFFASQGGDVNVGAHVPLLAHTAGFAVEEVNPTIKVGRPGSATWRWLTDYFFSVMDRYASFPPFTPEMAARLRRHWTRAAKDRSSLIVAPTVLDVVLRKR
jgi:SAM-dependent methyltransferase